MDANHNAKSMRGQALVGGMQMCVLGTCYIDAGLIKVSGIDVDLWLIHDYDSDALVLKLCSYTTVHQIMECLYVLPNSDTTEMNQAALIDALLFNRAFLYAVNRKGPLSVRGRIWMIWSECNCILSVHQGGVYCNKMKLLMGAMPLCFLAIDDLVDLMHSCTTDEVCEHLFGTWRGHSDGFTA
eukprot:scaffold6505_cov37-Attheya_sp.AAC.1